MNQQEPLVYYAWSDPQPLPAAPALPLPMQPYVNELYVPPMIQPIPSTDGARLGIWMVPAQAPLHSGLPNRTAIWTYRASPDAPEDPQPPVGPTIEVQQGQRTHIAWVNALTNPDGSFARHPVAAVRDLPAVVQLAESGTVHAPQNLPGFTLGQYDQADRKSTRLNSSHGSISYAVFCL